MSEEDVIHICNGIRLSHKKEQNDIICSKVDATREYHTKRSQSERETQTPHDITCIVKSKIGHK